MNTQIVCHQPVVMIHTDLSIAINLILGLEVKKIKIELYFS